MQETFREAVELDVNLGGWDVSKVHALSYTFYYAEKFAGGGLEQWQTVSVTSLDRAFCGASSMDTDIGKWNVSKVTVMDKALFKAAKFDGVGLGKWNVALVTDMTDIFKGATSLTPCSKRHIVDEWLKSSVPGKTAFTATTYDEDWANVRCFNDTTFKQATWDWVQSTATATTTWGAIGDWDVSEVTDFSYAFSQHRDEMGAYKGVIANGGNPKAEFFVGTDISTWITSAATNMQGLFYVRPTVLCVSIALYI